MKDLFERYLLELRNAYAKEGTEHSGRTLTLYEINNVENVANVLAFTIRQMKTIDEAYLKAFPEAV